MKKLLIISVCMFFSESIFCSESPKPNASTHKAAEAINKEKEKKFSSFIALVEQKKEAEILSALEADKDYNFVNVKVKGDHILTYCIKNKMWKIAEKLTTGGSNLNYKDKEGKVALMYAAEAKNKYLTTLLIATNADKQIKDNNGISAEEYIKKNGL